MELDECSGDHLYLASGGNTGVSTQMVMLISDLHGVKIGRSGWDGGNGTDLSTEYFRINTSGRVDIGINEDVPLDTSCRDTKLPELRLTNTTISKLHGDRFCRPRRFTEYETARMQGCICSLQDNKNVIRFHNSGR